MPKFLSLFFFVFLYFCISGYAQEIQSPCNKISNPYLHRIYKEAWNGARTSPSSSYNKMQKAIKIQPLFTEAYFLMALIDYQRGFTYTAADNPIYKPAMYFDNAEKNFLKVIEMCPRTESYSAYYYLGEYYYDRREFEKSKKYLSVFMANNTHDYDMIQNTISFLDNINLYYSWLEKPVSFSPKPIETINSENDEFLPLLSPDGEILFYTHRFPEITQSGKVEMLEKFCFSLSNKKKNDSISFFPGQPMPTPFNTGMAQGGASITIDNKQIFMTICENVRTFNTSYKNCDIYTSKKQNGNWSKLSKLGPNINSADSWEAQPSISADGQVLFFASTMAGGFGGIDIYSSVLDTLGHWGKAENLGSVVNTPFDDKTPFLHTDSKTLYFSSDGHFGLGGFDVFQTQYIGSGNWTKPKNVGYPINTENDEVAFTITVNGERFYFASQKFKGKGGWDLYTAALPDSVKPENVIFFKGQLFDNNGDTIKNAVVELQSMKTLRLTKGLVDRETGKYAIALAVEKGEDFLITVKKTGYFFASEYIMPNKRSFVEQPTEKDFELHPIEIGTKIRLKNIYFETNSAEFSETSIISLNNFTEFLEINPSLKIQLHGHTDDVGDSDSNKELSWKRAKAVYDYVVENGIAPKRADYKGFGETKPVASNATRTGRALNRRTEFVVIVK